MMPSGMLAFSIFTRSAFVNAASGAFCARATVELARTKTRHSIERARANRISNLREPLYGRALPHKERAPIDNLHRIFSGPLVVNFRPKWRYFTHSLVAEIVNQLLH